MDVEKRIFIAIRVLLTIAGASLAYLLFMFGHAEPEYVPLARTLVVAGVGALSALVGGILMWAGVPKAPEPPKKKKGSARH